MCDAQADEEMTPKAVLLGAKNTGPKLCIKCKQAQPNVLIRNIRYCKTCFLYAFEGKFRSIMNRAKATNDPSMKNILMGFSGGPSSRAMLQLLHQYTSSHNKYGELKILFIDESLATEDHGDHLGCIQKIAKLYPFELIIKRIEEPMGSKEAFLDAFNGLFLYHLREDFLSSLRHSLLVHTARESKCSMLLLGDSATRIAIKTISLTSKGRGFSLPFEVAAESSCYEGLSIIRPMRDNLSKEVALYNHHTQLYHPSIKSILYKTKPKASIDRITEEFIAGLDSGFPSTVSTIVRTANKLTPSTNLAPGIWCPLCIK
ncbi:Cytoplasmic tRNA 2-thiolation protein 2, variant 2 [Entomophthora muscae]|uniref:Cytoplasmic tRNA 2-thiolation protein 2, variant 2 n=1 Tax=Entomophthora muscae TaxID=34485 RepID=A0ACC2U7T4_9FUNG|nr:Cytoplasmic tRNA 2-thiolation protein 2, variant 2 [Entomophthora muscae]